MRRFGWDVSTCWSRKAGDPLPDDIEFWSGDYIFCFRSFYILKDSLLSRAKQAAINFHPGPPNYRGVGCLNRALFSGEKIYGVTCHHMVEEVDSGSIVTVDLFDILESDDVPSLTQRAHHKCYNLASDVIRGISVEGRRHLTRLEEKNDFEWSGDLSSRDDLDAKQFVSPEIGQRELEARVRAYHSKDYPLKLDLHGHVFVMQAQKKKPGAEAPGDRSTGRR